MNAAFILTTLFANREQLARFRVSNQQKEPLKISGVKGETRQYKHGEETARIPPGW
jgi:hypothetical protein